MKEDFILSCYLAAAATSLGLLLFARRRHLVIKPSFFCLLFFNLQLQWSSALRAGAIYDTLRSPWDYFFIVLGFPLVGLLTTRPFFNSSAVRVSEALRRDSFVLDATVLPVIGLLACLVVATFAWYFQAISFRDTGLYALFFNTENANVARENSLKLLPSAELKYAMSLTANVLIPFLAVLLLGRLRHHLVMERFFSRPFALLGLAGLVAAVSITGARSPAAMLLITLILALTLRMERYPGPFKVAALGAVVLLVPAVVSMIRETGGVFSWIALGENYANAFDRAFGRVVEDGIWHMEYVQQHGFFGWPGVGNVASWLGYEPINIFNVVGLTRVGTIASVSSNTAFPVAYYDCFGLISYPLSLLLLVSLDGLLLLWERLKTPFLLPCVAASLMACISLVSTFFTTVLFTYGLGLLPLLGLGLQVIFLPRPEGPRMTLAKA